MVPNYTAPTIKSYARVGVAIRPDAKAIKGKPVTDEEVRHCPATVDLSEISADESGYPPLPVAHDTLRGEEVARWNEYWPSYLDLKGRLFLFP
jgi:hypothetical protein